MHIRFFTLAALAVAAIAGLATSRREEPSEIDPAQLRSFAPLPAEFKSQNNPIIPSIINLGRMLFYGARGSFVNP